MNNKSQHILFLFIFVISVYCVLFYTILTCQYNLDFASFYSAALASIKGENPYRVWLATYLPVTKKIAVNLNPPIALLIFNPLARISYPIALAIWLIVSFTLGLIGAGIAFNYTFSTHFLKKNWLVLYLVYLSLFSTLMNISIAQLGAILLFFIMLGYHFYLKNRDYLAGIMWGFIISVKLFPALLFFYVLKQGRFKVFTVMVVVFLLACLIPLLVYGPTVYKQYYSMMSSVFWYGDSWNASIYGFLSRLFINTRQGLPFIKTIYAILFVILLIGYLKKLGPSEINPINHQPFCLTLVMMLLLSPLGWIYYFPILIFPLVLTWVTIIDEKIPLTKAAQLWLLCLFFINFPISNVISKRMTDFVEQIGFSSFYFYGLLLLAFFLMIRKKLSGKNEVNIDETKQQFILAIFIILAFGLIVPSTGFFMRLSTPCQYQSDNGLQLLNDMIEKNNDLK